MLSLQELTYQPVRDSRGKIVHANLHAIAISAWRRRRIVGKQLRLTQIERSRSAKVSKI
jgi:hypothetical protein